jgi:hypothetical protein
VLIYGDGSLGCCCCRVPFERVAAAAPLFPLQVCEKCDVWSMGVVMWEMFTLQVPFQELSAQQILMGLMQVGRSVGPLPCSHLHPSQNLLLLGHGCVRCVLYRASWEGMHAACLPCLLARLLPCS